RKEIKIYSYLSGDGFDTLSLSLYLEISNKKYNNYPAYNDIFEIYYIKQLYIDIFGSRPKKFFGLIPMSINEIKRTLYNRLKKISDAYDKQRNFFELLSR